MGRKVNTVAHLIIQEEPSSVKNPYAKFKLTDNPFPVDGILTPQSPDPRNNGTIFANTIRREIMESFETKLIGKGSFDNRYRLGYLWAQGGVDYGRGVGKTALLKYFQTKINADWGESYFGHKTPVCVLYAAPPQVKDKPLEYICLLALRNLQEIGVLDSVVLTIRWRVIQKGIAQGDIESIKQELSKVDANVLLDDKWLATKDVDIDLLNEAVVGELSAKGVDPNFARAVSRRDIVSYLKSFRRDNQITIPHPPRDTTLISMLKDLFFNQAVRALEAGGFAGTYLFVDDIENIVDQPSRKYREIFAKELAYIQFRMDYDAGIKRFLTIVLTTHDNAAYKLSEAWNLAGLASSLAMAVDSPNSIQITAPTLPEMKEIFKAHLKYYRIPGSKCDPLFPFQPATIKQISEQSQYHPRKSIARANRIIEAGRARSEIIEITPQFADEIIAEPTSAEPQTISINDLEGGR
jgi:hypothetical protein